MGKNHPARAQSQEQSGAVATLVTVKIACPTAGTPSIDPMMIRKSLLALSLLAACPLAAAGPPVAAWTLEWGAAWTVRGDFPKGRDLSAAAAFGLDHGLAASDETRAAQRVSFDPAAKVLTVHESLPLLAGKTPELDLEGAAASTSQRAYFLVGSQALSRKKDVFERDRGWLFKLPVDDANRPQPGAVAKADLRAVLTADAVLAPFLNQPSDENGLDIEGLAEREGRLFLGLRGPVRDGQATILEVGVDELFAGKATLRHHRLALGPGRGVRDLTALADGAGFLVLAGPSGGADGGKSATGAKYEVWHWAGPDTAATRLGPLGAVAGEPDAKAEALVVLRQTPTAIEGVVLHDGPKNGAPQGFRLNPPPAP
jgi:hypothetical protein